jgi:transcriptional antiterminator RfaH
MTKGNSTDMPRWYAIHTHPNQEERANSNLNAWKVETFAPKIRVRRFNQFTGAASYVLRPLFSRYIFARFDSNNSLHKIHFTRGVHSVVSFGGFPSPVDDEIIALIRSRVDENWVLREDDDLTSGDKVLIEDGPLKGFMGVFERRLKATDRILILLSAIKYQGHVVVSREAIRKVAC